MKKNMLLNLLFFILLFSIVLPSDSMTVHASSYSGDYRSWSQSCSDDSGMRSVGCLIVAQAKMIYEANINRDASFNPDVYFHWLVNNGYLPGYPSDYSLSYGSADGYARSLGKNLEFLGFWNADDDQLWFNIKAGYYTIVKVNGPNVQGTHWVMLANELSLSTGQLYCYDSGWQSAPSPHPLSDYYASREGGQVFKGTNPPPHTHSYTSSVTRQPTCTAAGVRTFSCSCGSSYTEEIAATGHKYVDTVVDPTMTEQGYTLHKCSVCGDTTKDHYTGPITQEGDWYYSDVLPSDIDEEKYTIEYNNYYEAVQSSSPGADWTDNGLAREEWQNSGEPYKTEQDLPTSAARVLVASIYYHFCGPNSGGYSNYTMDESNNYVHYDWIPASSVSAVYAGDDAGHPYYFLYGSDGSDFYCQSGVTCDGSWGSHGARGKTWYKENTYQDRIKITQNKYTKESGWTNAKDSSAASVKYRYQEKNRHVHSYTSSVTRDATCISEGEITYSCDCGASYTETIPKEEHSWDNGMISKAPSCTEKGTTTYTCTVCGETKEESIDIDETAHPGAVDIKGQKAATCTSEGYTGDTYCAACGAKLADGATTAKTEHDWDTGVVTKEATATEDGIKTFTCKTCGTVKTETINATGGNDETEGSNPPQDPGSTQTPANPQNPGTTQTPVDPQNPDTTQTPANPQNPGTTQTPANPQNPDGTQTPTNPQNPGTTQTPADSQGAQDSKNPQAQQTPQAAAPAYLPTGTVISNISGGSFKVTAPGCVEFLKPQHQAKTATIQNSIKVNGTVYQVTSIAANAFKNNKKLTKLVIGNNIQKIGANAFSNCRKLKIVSMGDKVTAIGARAFYQCVSLTKIVIPQTVKSIGKQAFYGCKKMKTISIWTKKLKTSSIGKKAFSGINKKAVFRISYFSKVSALKKILKSKGAPKTAKYKIVF